MKRMAAMGIALLVTAALMPGVARAQWSTDDPPPPAAEEPTLGDRHRVEVTPLAGYQVGGGVSGEEGEIDFPEGVMYGAMIDVWVRPDAQAEFLYTRQETSIEFDPTGVAPRSMPAT